MIKVAIVIYLSYVLVSLLVRLFLIKARGRCIALGLYEEEVKTASYFLAGLTASSRDSFGGFIEQAPGDVWLWQSDSHGFEPSEAAKTILDHINEYNYTDVRVYAIGNSAKIAHHLSCADQHAAKASGEKARITITWLLNPVQNPGQLSHPALIWLAAIVAVVITITLGLVSLLPIIPFSKRLHSPAELSDQLIELGFSAAKTPSTTKGMILCQNDQHVNNARVALDNNSLRNVVIPNLKHTAFDHADLYIEYGRSGLRAF